MKRGPLIGLPVSKDWTFRVAFKLVGWWFSVICLIHGHLGFRALISSVEPPHPLRFHHQFLKRCRGFRNRKPYVVSSALVETAVSIAVAATVVGTAATLLAKRTKVSQIPMKTCEDCNGSGICPECRGEGFVLKRPSEENAERARLTAKNMATRYSAGLPKKWIYCTRCSSSHSCITCDGRGELSL